MATKTTTLFSLAKVKTYLNLQAATHDAVLEQIADGCSARVESFCQRLFVKRSVTEIRDGSGNARLTLRHYPIVTLTSAAYRFTLLDAWVALNVATEVELDDVTGTLYLKQLAWPKGTRTSKAVYDAGYDVQDGAALPSDVYQIGLDYCKFVYDRWKAHTISTGSVSVGGLAGSVVAVPDIPKDMKDALAIHIKHRL